LKKKTDLKFISIIFLTLVICFQSLQGFFTIVNWKLNQAEITEKFCENKAKMNIHCDGKCYLSKQLKLQENEEQADLSKKQLPKLKKIKEIEVFSEFEYVSININAEFELQNKPNTQINLNYNSEDVNLCFQPPQFS
jgi:hypothetical protein